jgi:uncharacterized protein YcfJ
MNRFALILTLTGTVALGACTAGPQSQDAQCIAGAAGGAAVGVLLGREIGQGTGRDIATAAGGAAGALTGASVLCP